MTDLKISIIVPVYNSEKYIADCVRSISNQTYKNIEIILVNDGSTDTSGEICDRLAQNDERIKVIHKENGGTSAARNDGIDAASGDYITFVDNDDTWQGTDSLQKMINLIADSHADIIMHDCTVKWLDSGDVNAPSDTVKREFVVGKSAGEALSHIIGSNVFSLYCVWSKLFKASLIKNAQIRFPEGMRNEDIAFCFEALVAAKSYDWYEGSFYLYNKGHSTAQTKQGIRYELVRDLRTVFEQCLAKLNDSCVSDELRDSLLSYLAFPFCVWMGQSKMIRDPRIKRDAESMKKHRHILRHNLHPSVKKVTMVLRLLGFALTSRLLAVYIKRSNHL